jgi:tetratricopeptide (TPR) repeat protein
MKPMFDICRSRKEESPVKRISLFIVLLGVVIAFFPPLGSAQSEKQGIAIFNEAHALQKNARSKEDLEKTLTRFQQALDIFRRVKSEKSEGETLHYMGSVQERLGQYQKAVEYYEKALEIHRKVGNKEWERAGLASIGAALANTAQDYDKLGQYRNALDYLEKALDIARKTGDIKSEGTNLGNIGVEYARLGQYQKALDYYEKALQIAKKIGDAPGEGAHLVNIGWAYYKLSQHEKSLEYDQKALEIFTKIGNKQGEGQVVKQLGAAYGSLGQFQKSLEYYEKSSMIYKEIGNGGNEADSLIGAGAACYNLGQYQEALGYYGKSLDILRMKGDRNTEGTLLGLMAGVYENLGQHEKTLEYYEKELEIQRKIGNKSEEAGALGYIGHFYMRLGEYQKAIESYEKSLTVLQKAGDLKGELGALRIVGQLYLNWSQYEKAIGYYEQSLAVAGKVGDLQGEEAILKDIGWAYARWDRYHKAIEYYEKSLAVAGKVGDLKGEGAILADIGSACSFSGQDQKAQEYYERSLAVARKVGDLKGEGDTLFAMAGFYKDRAQYQNGLEYYQQSLAIFRKVGNLQSEGFALRKIGGIYSSWGQYAKTIDYYEQSLAIAKKVGGLRTESECLGDMGLVYNFLGQYEKAIMCYENSLEIDRKEGNFRGEAITLHNLAGLFQMRGQQERSLALRNAALDIDKRTGAPDKGDIALLADLYLDMGDVPKAEPLIREAGLDSSLGRLNLVKGNYKGAFENYHKALVKFLETRQSQALFIALTGLGFAYEGDQQFQAAAQCFSQAIELVERIREGLSETMRINFYDFRGLGFARIAPYQGLCRVLMQLGNHEESFKMAESTKARVFAESLCRRGQGGTLDVPQDVLEKDDDITNRLAAMAQQLNKAYEKGSKDAIESFERHVKDLREDRDRHVAKLRQDYPRFAATRYPQPMGLSETALKENERTVEYVVSDSGVLIYVTQGKRFVKALFNPVALKEVDDLVRKFRAPMEVGGADNIEEKMAKFDFASGKRLYDILLAPIIEELPEGAPLIIVPDGSLGVVPFEMLVLNDGGKVVTENKRAQTTGAEFFGDRNPISYYQSITALTLVRTLGQQQKAGDKTLAMVDPVFSADDPRLAKVAKQERDRLLANLPTDLTMSIETENGLTFRRLPLTTQLGESLKKSDPQRTDLYEGLNVKKTALLDKDLTPYRSLVFATHGYFGKDLPGIQEPVLVMSLLDQPKGQDGFLRLSEVMGLKLNCEIAALTACQTGLGKHISGEGTMGMGRAFQYAGAKSVLMSLWSVSETASVNLVESFFKHVGEGKSKLEALKLAREEIRKAGYDHPFYWAPFILVGEAQ